MTATELTELLDRLIADWENEVVEFKTASNQYSADKTGEYVSAIANEANLRGLTAGWMVFGIDNDRDVVGTAHLSTSQSLQSLKHYVQHSIDQGLTLREIYEIEYKGKRVVLAEIPAAPAGIPISWKGDFRARAGESLAPLSLDKLDQIRNQTIGTDWTAVVVEDATIAHLDQSAIARARQGFTDRHAARIPAAEIAAWSDATFLAKARLARDGGITRAALLLLGSDTSTHLLSPHPAQLTWKLVGQESAYRHFRLPFLLNATELASQIRNVQLRLLPPNELIYREISKYDERSILEALYNCVAHQDYTKDSRVIVTESVDRLVFESVGEFYDGTPDDYALEDRTPRKYRNPFLVEAMTELNLIDQMGYGIHRMVQDQVRRFLPLPDYDLSRPGEVKLTIPGGVIDEAYSRLLMVRTDLPLDDVLALDRVQKHLPIADDAVARLKRAKLIEGRKPRFHVSAVVADATDARAQYMQTRALDDEYYAKLVVEYLERFGQGTRKEIDAFLWNKLPDVLTADQKQSKVHNLLTRLRKQGAIESVGATRSARWQLS
ncbi:RNA-binding domain-containing protein [Glaciibacter flavus]|uniref:RNA-binding domain-containing protein n=1 Tax=Orlajensenia flava TaxID=2565934 RepID=UPI003B001EF6